MNELVPAALLALSLFLIILAAVLIGEYLDWKDPS